MRANPSREYQIKEKNNLAGRLSFSERKIQNSFGGTPAPVISLSDIFQKLLAGLQRWWVAIRYRFYQLTAGFFDGFRIPWFKVGLAFLVIFIFTKKDIQFSINMRAPLAAMMNDDRNENGEVQKMSLVQPVRVSSRTTNDNAALPPAGQLDEKKTAAYIKRFAKVAGAEMEKFGIPASVKMAQGILESKAGEHPAARQFNNHFGKLLGGQSYNSAWENWRAHSNLVANDYPELLKLGNNYKKWAKELQNNGYSNDRNYARQLIEIVEKYNLQQLDEQ